MERQSGIRKYSDREIDALRCIERLKSSGHDIREMKTVLAWTTQGSAAYLHRKHLFADRNKLSKKIFDSFIKTLDMLKYKCWYYETAIADGNEERIAAMLPDRLPLEIQKLYDNAHD